MSVRTPHPLGEVGLSDRTEKAGPVMIRASIISFCQEGTGAFLNLCPPEGNDYLLTEC